jgi:hypothetical protein
MKIYYLAIFFLIACNGSRQAERQVRRAYVKHPEIIAKSCSQWFPFTETIVVDSHDVNRFDSGRLFILSGIDTIYRYITDTIVLNKLTRTREYVERLKPVERTIYVRDSATIYVNQVKADKATKQNDSLKWWLIGVLCLLVIILLLQILKK